MPYRSSNVTVMVSDFDRAVRFYTEGLGLRLLYRGGDHWATIAAPGLTIGLHPKGEHGAAEPTPSTRSISIGLEVEDLDAAIAELRGKGVELGPEIDDDGFIQIANFNDPDGTPLYLFQMTGASEGGTH